MEDCIFCKLANGEIPTEMVYEDDKLSCFKDINPQAETHVLIVPKAHFKDIEALAADEAGRETMTAVLEAIPKIARKLGVAEKGYRIINNCGAGAGQSVFHVHFHLLADERLKEILL